MAKDTNLAFLKSVAEGGTGPLTINTATNAIVGAAKDTEGGFYAEVRVYTGAFTTGTNFYLDLDIMASVDGTNYRSIGKFPRLVAITGSVDANSEIARVVYVPKPILASSLVTKVRVWYTSTNTPGAFVLNRVELNPLVSLGAPAVDEGLATGLAKLAVTY